MTMENSPPAQSPSPVNSVDAPISRKRSGSGGSILSRFPFLRTPENKSNPNDSRSLRSSSTSEQVEHQNAPDKPPRAFAAALAQQSSTRRRRGSLRKVALLGRGAAREKKETRPEPSSQQSLKPEPLAIETPHILRQQIPVFAPTGANHSASPAGLTQGPIIGLGISDVTPRPSIEGSAPRDVGGTSSVPTTHSLRQKSSVVSYTSTTDEEDGVSMSLPVPPSLQTDRSSFSSNSATYFQGSSHRATSPAHSIQRRRSISKQKYAKSPLSLQGLATGSPALGGIDSGPHDYSETEWWGWVLLVVTWVVFIVGMGSCFNIWSWSWDVGSTPYAPPELEDDPTLPVVGYYPALMILTSIMAWVWVIVAWVGMKYFRHAKITGD
ncbi:hypothetical protein GGS20DRAFT_402314 [Poronia punctata]|nr:hypothetical protein GGS20DRAFT_402314 [Poronia punctata]